MKLNCKNLSKLSEDILVPKYKKEDLTPGIVHFGVGNFNRSHQAVYLNELFNNGLDYNWAIVGSGMHSHGIWMGKQLKIQDYLFSVIERSVQKDTMKIIGVITNYICGIDKKEEIINQLCDERIKIVSLTITEGGYFIDSSTGFFDKKNKEIIQDSNNPDTPITVFGIIIKALKIRKTRSIQPFTIMSCDNIPHNGNITKNTTVGLAKLIDEKFAEWIEKNVAFPNGMVDRITPSTTLNEIEYVKNNYGIEDSIPVFSEDFKQWILEDNFPTGRPALEKVGVEFVRDVTPYEHMKIRILNGGHALIAYASGLLDIEYVYEAMKNSLILKFFKKVEENEILPVLPSVPNTNLHSYYLKIQERFSNPKIKDTIKRLCLDGSNRQPKFIIPTINDCIKKSIDFKGLAIESALWCRYCYGITESNIKIEPNDPNWNSLKAKAIEAKKRPISWIEMKHIYGNVAKNIKFQEYFNKYLNDIWNKGVANVIEEYTKN